MNRSKSHIIHRISGGTLLLFFALFMANPCFSQLTFDKINFNFGTVEINQAYLDIYLVNTSNETIYSINQQVNPIFRSKVIQSPIPPGGKGILRIECKRLTGNVFNGEIALFINESDAPLNIRIKGKYKNNFSNINQGCPDFSKSKKKVQTGRVGKQQIQKRPIKTLWAKVELEKSKIAGNKLATKKYKPNNLIILLDASSSMKELRKKVLLQKAFTEMTSLLRPIDQVSIIAYASKSILLMPPKRNVSEEELIKLIEKISTDGFTNGSQGIESAYKLADSIYDENANNEIILATDGAFNANETNNITEDIIAPYAHRNIRLSILGIHNKNWAVAEMRQLAKAGRGKYMSVRSPGKAKRSLRKTIKNHSRL